MAASKSWLIPIDRCRSASRRDAVGDPGLLQVTQLPEPGPRLLRIVAPGRQQHEPLQPHRAAVERGINEASRRVARGAELGRLAGEIDLHEDVRASSRVRGRRRVEPLQQVERID